MKKWLPLLLPAFMLAVLTVVLAFYEGANRWLDYPSFRALPYFTLAVSFLLGISFLQSRVSFMCLFLGVVTFYLDRTCATEGLSAKCDVIIFLSSVYVSVFGVLFYHLSERGFLTVDGYVRLVIILSGVVVLLLVPNIADMSKALSSTSVMLFRAPSAYLNIPLAGLLVFAICLPFFFFRSGFESPLLGYFFCLGIVYVFAALNLNSAIWPEASRRVVFLSFMSGAALTFAFSVMESSWRNAHIDELTELPGRRSFKHHLERLKGEYVIAMVDVDHFKKVNDRYGHDTGDQALRFIASFLRHNVIGKAYRYGGEEFAIIAEGVEYRSAVELLDELRSSIGDRDFIVRSLKRPKKKPSEERRRRDMSDLGKKITITVSIGAAQSGEKYLTSEEVVEAADKALYRAKKAGRNRVSAVGIRLSRQER